MLPPPIPEPIAYYQVPRIRTERPAELIYLIGADALVQVMRCFTNALPDTSWFATFTEMGLWALILYFLWRGYNWARAVVVLGSLVMIAALIGLRGQTLLQTVGDIVYALLGAVWIWWVMTPAMIGFTKGRPKS